MIAISTAFKNALIAIDVNGKHAFSQIDANCKHSENILLNIDKLLDEINVDFKDNNDYAVVIGPGSFTGIRIGIALVKGFVAGNGKDDVTFLTTFDLMAYSYVKKANPKTNFYCVVDALSGLCFVCEYDKNGTKVGDEKMISTSELESLNATKVGLSEESLCTESINPTAEELLEISLKKKEEGQKCSANNLTPLYLRKSQAEVSLENKTKI